MNMRQQSNYLDSIFPEVILAMQREYSPDKRFLNTKYIKEQIRMFPQDFPILATKSDQHVTEAITTCLDKKLHYKKFNSSVHRAGVRIFVRSEI